MLLGVALQWAPQAHNRGGRRGDAWEVCPLVVGSKHPIPQDMNHVILYVDDGQDAYKWHNRLSKPPPHRVGT